MKKTWYVYILRCHDDTLYTGITIDLERRLDEHNHSRLGARYTRNRRPVRLIYSIRQESRSAASRLERQIKRLSRQQKQLLIEGNLW